MADETPSAEDKPVDETPADEAPAREASETEAATDGPRENDDMSVDAAEGPTATPTSETLPVDQQGVDEPMPAEIGEPEPTAATMTTTADGDIEITSGEPDPEPEEEPEPLPELNIGAAVYTDGDLPEMNPLVRGKVDKFGVAMGTGRRKTAVARVRIKSGDGQFEINGRPLDEFLSTERDRQMVMAPLEATGMAGKVDVWVKVKGGGTTGQTGAILLGIARALEAHDPSLHTQLSEGHFLTRDERMVERKKYGLAKARKSFQFSKR